MALVEEPNSNEVRNSSLATLHQENSVLVRYVGGIWHTGVVVYGNEYFFERGIQTMRPDAVVRVLSRRVP